MTCRILSQVSIGLSGLLAACTGPDAMLGTPPHGDTRMAVGGRSAVIRLPGLQYEVLGSGTGGVRALRQDDVAIRYVGQLVDGSIFSTSRDNGAQPSTFSVRTVIPGFSALVQLMQVGDRWRFIIPAYLGYGHEGRRFKPPEETLRRDIPPNSTLIFDVELVAIVPAH